MSAAPQAASSPFSQPAQPSQQQQTGSPFAAPQAASPGSSPGMGLSPFGMQQAPQQASTGAPTAGIPGSSPGMQQTVMSSTNYFEDLDQGKTAIRSQNKPGFVFLTNPYDEDNQRINQILELTMFKEILKDFIFIKIDVEKNPNMLTHYGIYKTPSVILYDSKGLMRKKIQSLSDMNYFLQEIRKLKE